MHQSELKHIVNSSNVFIVLESFKASFLTHRAIIIYSQHVNSEYPFESKRGINKQGLETKYIKNFKSEFVLHTRKSEGYCIKEKKFTRLPIRFFLYLLSLGIQCVFIIISMFIEMFMLYLLSYIERLQNSSSFYECS